MLAPAAAAFLPLLLTGVGVAAEPGVSTSCMAVIAQVSTLCTLPDHVTQQGNVSSVIQGGCNESELLHNVPGQQSALSLLTAALPVRQQPTHSKQGLGTGKDS